MLSKQITISPPVTHNLRGEKATIVNTEAQNLKFLLVTDLRNTTSIQVIQVRAEATPPILS